MQSDLFMNRIDRFKMINEDGTWEECLVLFAFRDDETQKAYVAYAVEAELGNDCTRVYAGTFDPEEFDPMTGRLNLLPVETDGEWEMVAKVFDQVLGEKGS